MPAIIIVKGDVDIDGIIHVNGSNGQNGQGDAGGAGGIGGPGGGGGGAGNDDNGGNGGAGFTGGGGGGGTMLIFGQGVFDVTANGIIESNGGDGGTTTDDANSGEGGGGSGGGIILQGISVDASAGTISAVGGDGPNGGGDGGDGRIRVDGVRLGTPSIEGIVGGYGGSQFVGPSITGFNGTHIKGTGGPNANVTLVIQHSTGGTDYYKYLQIDTNREYSLPISFTDGAHYITAIQNSTFNDAVMSSAATHIVFKRTLIDSVSSWDYTILVMQVSDETASVDDIVVKAPVTMRPFDVSSVDDQISFKVTKGIEDLMMEKESLVESIMPQSSNEKKTKENVIEITINDGIGSKDK